MSKIAVVYTSKYGSARRYAKWIAEETGATVFDAKRCKVSDLKDFDTIVYGGGIHAGGIEGIDFLKKNFSKLSGKKIICYAVGLRVDGDDVRQQCRDINFVKKMADIPCYFFHGAYNPAQVKGIDKVLMKIVKHMVVKKKDKDEEDEKLLKAITDGGNFASKDQIAPLVEALKA